MITDWDKIIQRIRSEVDFRLGMTGAHRQNGSNQAIKKEGAIVGITITMLVDCDNRPLVWTVESKRVEPGSRAKELLELY